MPTCSGTFLNGSALSLGLVGPVVIHPSREVHSVTLFRDVSISLSLTELRRGLREAANKVRIAIPSFWIDYETASNDLQDNGCACIAEKLSRDEADMVQSSFGHIVKSEVHYDWEHVNEMIAELDARGECIGDDADPSACVAMCATYSSPSEVGCSPDTCMKWMQNTGYLQNSYTCNICETTGLIGMHWHCAVHRGDICSDCGRTPTRADWCPEDLRRADLIAASPKKVLLGLSLKVPPAAASYERVDVGCQSSFRPLSLSKQQLSECMQIQWTSRFDKTKLLGLSLQLPPAPQGLCQAHVEDA